MRQYESHLDRRAASSSQQAGHSAYRPAESWALDILPNDGDKSETPAASGGFSRQMGRVNRAMLVGQRAEAGILRPLFTILQAFAL